MTMPSSGREEEAQAPPAPFPEPSEPTAPEAAADEPASFGGDSSFGGVASFGGSEVESGHRPQQDWLTRDAGEWSGWASTNRPGGGWNPDAAPSGEATPKPRPAWDSPSRVDLPGVSPITRAERRRAEQQQAASTSVAPEGNGYPSGVGQAVWALARLALGFLFLWTFADALFGLNRPTPSGFGWLDGVSPTGDYLEGVHNSLGGAYHWFAGRAWVDSIFMLALVFVGVALVLGVAVTLAAAVGSALMIVVWMTALPLVGAPLVDHHIVYALVLIGIAATGAGLRYSLASRWRRTSLTRRLPFLR